MLNEKFTFSFKITIKRNLTKSHLTILKSGKFKTHVIKEQLLKWMSNNKMNRLTAYRMMKLCSLAVKKFQRKRLFLFKGGWFLLIRRLSININLKTLLLVARIEKSSKSGAWLQNKRYSLMAESSSTLTLFPASAKIPKCSLTLT